MSDKFSLKGLCACGHDPEEDPNEDCERCWLVTWVWDLKHASVEDEDSKSALRDELARVRRERDALREAAAKVLGQLDYLQDLWGKEGVTNTLAESLRAALAAAPAKEADHA